MAFKLAVTGKSGSGKTTVVKAFLRIMQEYFPGKSILLFDNDLTSELGHSFGQDIRNTIYGIRSGKHEYKTGIPEGMSKQEFVEWAMEDIVVTLDENVDIIVSWFVGSKDCRCPITGQINDAVLKLIDRYDFVLFDCEYDLKYLVQLVDYPIDTTILVSKADLASLHLASIIYESNKKYAAEGQFSVILNMIKEKEQSKAHETANSFSLNTLGLIKQYENEPDNDELNEIIKNMYQRLNLPQNTGF